MRQKYQSKKFDWLKFGVSLVGALLLGLLVIGVSLLGVNKRTDRKINLGFDRKVNKKNIVKTASYHISYQRATVSSELSFNIQVDPGQNQLDGADLLLSYDVDNIKIKSISLGTAFTRYHFKDNSGFLKINAWNDDPTLLLKNKAKLATVYYDKLDNSVDNDQQIVKIVCNPGSSTDSNLTQDGKDVLACDLNQTYASTTDTNSATDSGEVASIFLLDQVNQDSAGSVDNLSVKPRILDQYFTDGCNKIAPPRPTNLKAVPGPGYGEVTLTWEQKSYATHYAVTYGTKWMDFEYGDIDMGGGNSYVVKGLRINVPYYFVITAVDHCASSGYSDGASAYAGGSGVKKTVSKTSTTVKPKQKQVKTFKKGGYNWAYQNVGHEKGGTQSAALASATPQPTPTPTPEPETELPQPSRDSQFLDLALKYLPWVGLGLLVLLTILLIAYASSKNKNLKDLEVLVQDKDSNSDINSQPNTSPQSVKDPNDFRYKR